MYEGDEIGLDRNGTFDRPGAIMSSSPEEQQNIEPAPKQKLIGGQSRFRSRADDSRTSAIQDYATVVNTNRSERSSLGRFLMFAGIGVAAILLIVVAVVFLVGRGGSGGGEIADDGLTAGVVNPKIIFDKSAPVPLLITGRGYGYINVETGKWIVEPKYASAGQFYGNFAEVLMNGKIYIINRKGETVLTLAQDAEVKFDINENLWFIDGDIYNSAMKKTNPDDSQASYLGYGYAFIIPRNEDKESEFITGIPYLANAATGDKVFECEAIGCVIALTQGLTDDNLYFATYRDGDGGKIYSLKDQKELRSVPATNSLVKLFNGVFMERNKETGAIVNYLTTDNDSVEASTKRPSVVADESISGSREYHASTCDGGYNIDSVIDDCSIKAYWELSKAVYNWYRKDGKDPILLLKDGKIHLYDMKNKKDIKIFEDTFSAETYDNSAFMMVYLNSGKKQICNILEPNKSCVEVKDGEVNAYAIYFTVDRKTYSYNLTEVQNAVTE